MKNKRLAIFIETIGIVFLLLSTIFFGTTILPKIFKITQTAYLVITSFLALSIVVICLWSVYNKKKQGSLSYFLQRFRLKKIRKTTVYRAFVIFLIATILSGFIKMLLEKYEIPFNSNEGFEGAKLVSKKEGYVYTVLLSFYVIFLGPLKEEIIFRGYLLPRQETALGKYAWILNGFAFNFAHLLVYDLASLLLIAPFSFLIAYKVQKHKDISIGLLAHFFMNTPFIIRLFIA